MNTSKRVGLFVSCPVDLFRPNVGFASVELLERAGYTVEVPAQSCCGQVDFNNGDPEATRKLAWQLVTEFEPFDFTVIPSGSCGGMIKLHYPGLFAGDPRLPRVQQFCDRVFELTTFLVEIADFQPDAYLASFEAGTVTYHDSCAGLRELNIKNQPRELLRRCVNLDLTEMAETEACCGFGGTFCVKFPDVSARMADEKLDNAAAVKADLLIGGDVSCLLSLAGRAKRRGQEIEVRHIAEVLTGDLSSPAIGEPGTRSSS